MKRVLITGFTLIEMLTVIAIIGIILAVSLPAFNNLMKSGGVSSASRQVSSTLSLARQYAITHHQLARVVFAYQQTGSSGQDMWYKSYAVMSQTNGVDWDYVGKWEYLPVGVVFLKTGTGSLDGATVDHALLPFQSSKQMLAFIEFNPTGTAANNSTLCLTEGFVDQAGIQTLTTVANTATITTDNVIGRIKLDHP